MQEIWYVAYGSNLCLDRFRCYLAGGTPIGGLRRYDGSRNPRDPLDTVGLEVPGGLVFAGRSSVWGGGMAFYDPQAVGRVAGRGYLVTGQQFADVVAQEMRRPPGGVFAQVVEGLLPVTGSVHTIGAGRYECLARLGTRDDAPMFTVTSTDVGTLASTAPSAPYLRCIAAGLREAHDWDVERIAGYLVDFPGVRGEWGYDELRSLVGAPVS
jgi:hypothetical protein